MIVCGSCEEEKWCLYDDGRWICKDCFIQAGGDYDTWDDLNEQAKQRREEKRAAMASEEYDEFAPSIKTAAKLCKYGCKTMIYWDDSVAERNKFVESETKLAHTFRRCSEMIKKGKIKE